MTPSASILEPNSNPALYVNAVVILYVDLPDTPLRASVPDQRQARMWFDRGVPLPVVESALLLASLRRLVRPADGPPLSPIRSLAYFQPSLTSCSPIARPTTTWNTCGSDYATWPQTRAPRWKLRKEKTLSHESANTWRRDP